MPGPVVSIGAMVMLTPGAAGAPDTGVIISVPMPTLMAGGMPLATAGAICQMVNSLTGIPYPMTIGPLASQAVKVNGAALLRMGDQIPSGPGVMMIIGPPAAPFVIDQS